MACRGARPDDVAACVDGGGAAVEAADCAEVDHPALLRPGEGMAGNERRGARDDRADADHLTARAHVAGDALGATAEGAEVDHSARTRPRESGRLEVAGDTAVDDHLAAA